MLSAGLEDQLDPPPSETLGNIASRNRVLARLQRGQASATCEGEGQDQLVSEEQLSTKSGVSWVAGDRPDCRAYDLPSGEDGRGRRNRNRCPDAGQRAQPATRGYSLDPDAVFNAAAEIVLGA